MKVKAEKRIVMYDSETKEFIHLSPNKMSMEELTTYIRLHSVPKDSAYDADNLWEDLKWGSNVYTLPAETGEEMVTYVKECIECFWD